MPKEPSESLKPAPKTPVAIVTGGAGFIGSHVVDELVKHRIKVVVIDDLSSGVRENLNPNVEFVKLSVTMGKQVMEVFKRVRPDYVFHLAAQILPRVSVNDPIKDAKINVLGTINVLEACKETGVKKVIVSSSGGIMYSNQNTKAKETDPIDPETPYGITKRAKEMYLEHYYRVFQLPYVALRFANVYGPRQRPQGGVEGGVIPICLQALLSGTDFYLTGDGRQTRDFVYVKDVARACVAAMKKPYVGIVNISSGKETSIQDVFKTAAKLTKSKQKPKRLPVSPGEKRRSCMSFGRAKRVLDWRPTVSLEEGMKKTMVSLKAQLKRASSSKKA